MRLFKKKSPKTAASEPTQFTSDKHELEVILNQLRNECSEAMDKHFQALIQGYSPANPIEEQEAREILKSLLGMAVSHRDKMVGRVEAGIEKGRLFDRYYGTLKQINQLTCQATTALHLMNSARVEYLDKKALYRHVLEQTYVGFPGDERQAARDGDSNADLWQSIFPKQAAAGGD